MYNISEYKFVRLRNLHDINKLPNCPFDPLPPFHQGRGRPWLSCELHVSLNQREEGVVSSHANLYGVTGYWALIKAHPVSTYVGSRVDGGASLSDNDVTWDHMFA